MKSVKIKRSELLEVLLKNRETHKSAFEKAFEGYRRECIKVLEQNLALVKENKFQVVMFTERAPQDHTSDYNRVIRMLEMSVDDTIELSSTEFECYVQDNWQWKQDWSVSNMKYTGA